jgi:3-methylcrotonyl-CoA carboxylase beta subunit
MGSCVAGGAYLPIMSDEALIVDKTGSIFLAGPYLVKAAIGEDADKETLGGATTQSEISGITDYKMKDDPECLDTIRDLIDKFGHFEKAGFDRAAPAPPKEDPKEILQIFPEHSTKPYKTIKILKRLVDDSKLTLYKKDYGKNDLMRLCTN